LSVLADTPSAIASTIFLRRASRTAIACSTAEFWPAGPRRPNAFSGVCQARLSWERNYAYGRKSVGRLQDGCAGRNKNSLSGLLRRGSKSSDLARPPGGWGVGERASPEHIARASVRYASCRLKVQQRPLSLRECPALVPVKLFKLGQGADQDAFCSSPSDA
jgi:hypothetical protein